MGSSDSNNNSNNNNASNNEQTTEPTATGVMETIETFMTDEKTPAYFKCPSSGTILREPVLLPHSGVIVSKAEAEKHPGVDFMHAERLAYSDPPKRVSTSHLDHHMEAKLKQVLSSEMGSSFKTCVHIMKLLQGRNDLQYASSVRQCCTDLFWKSEHYLSLMDLNDQERGAVFFTITSDGLRYQELVKAFTREMSYNDDRIVGLYLLFPTAEDAFNTLKFKELLEDDQCMACQLLAAFLNVRNFNLFKIFIKNICKKDNSNEKMWSAIRMISKNIERATFELICKDLPFEQHTIDVLLSTSLDPILLAQRDQAYKKELGEMAKTIQQLKLELASLTSAAKSKARNGSTNRYYPLLASLQDMLE